MQLNLESIKATMVILNVKWNKHVKIVDSMDPPNQFENDVTKWIFYWHYNHGCKTFKPPS
jgi:hypothetical protein